MEKEEVIKNLKEYNAWRAGAPVEMLKVEVISETINEAIRLLEEDKLTLIQEDVKKLFDDTLHLIEYYKTTDS